MHVCEDTTWGLRLFRSEISFAGIKLFLHNSISALHLQSQNEGELSSAGSEHLPYKQRVGGSNPSAPTEIQAATICSGFFVLIQFKTTSLVLQSKKKHF